MKKLKAVYCFKLTDGPQGKEGVWYVDAKNGKGSVEFGEKGKVSRNFSLSSYDVIYRFPLVLVCCPLLYKMMKIIRF